MLSMLTGSTSYSAGKSGLERKLGPKFTVTYSNVDIVQSMNALTVAVL